MLGNSVHLRQGATNQSLVTDIKRIIDDEKGPGAPRINRRLREEGKRAGRQRVARIMRSHVLRQKRPRNTRPPRTASTHCPLANGLGGRISRRTRRTRSGYGVAGL